MKEISSDDRDKNYKAYIDNIMDKFHAKEVYSRVKGLLKKLELQIRYKVDNLSSFMYAFNHDKKNSAKIRFVLLQNIENCKIKIEVDEENVFRALKESISRG